MSVKVSYKWLLAPKFAETVKKISQFGGFPSVKQSYNAARLVELLESELKKAQREWIGVKAKYAPILGRPAEKNEDGTSKEPTEEFKKAQAEFNEEMTAVLSQTVVFEKRDLIKASELDKLGLSPAELLCVFEVLDFSDLDDMEAKAKELANHASELVSPQL